MKRASHEDKREENTSRQQKRQALKSSTMAFQNAHFVLAFSLMVQDADIEPEIFLLPLIIMNVSLFI